MNVSKSALLLASVAAALPASAQPRKLISLADGIAPLASRFNIQRYRQPNGDWGQRDARNVESHDELNLKVTLKPQRGFSGLAMTFQCENALPNKLSEIKVTPTFLDDDNHESSNKKVEGGKMGDVTILTKSLNPLRDHFNANKDKHRFVAILSPT